MKKIAGEEGIGLKTYKKPRYYNQITKTTITIDLNDERQTVFRVHVFG